MCDPRSNSASHFLATLLGKEDQSEYKMPKEHDNNKTGDLSSVSDEKNIIHPTTID